MWEKIDAFLVNRQIFSEIFSVNFFKSQSSFPWPVLFPLFFLPQLKNHRRPGRVFLHSFSQPKVPYHVRFSRSVFFP